jgi:diguanylate cyclase (GGDEF)-like protein
MPESAAEPTPPPYIPSEEDKDNAGRLKSDVAHQVHFDIRQEAKRRGLEIHPDDSPAEKARKNQAIIDLFNERSQNDVLDYPAAQIVAAEEQAGRDPLTGLLNRREFTRLFHQSLQQSNEIGRPILFLMIDLDYFKQINNTYGHSIGDQVLKYLARALTDSVEIGDLIARWGGEEFTVAVIPKADQPLDYEKLLMAAERIRAKVIGLLSEDFYQFSPGKPERKLPDPITLSLGATLTKPDDTLETACGRADDNLYKAKNAGRDQSFGDNGKI